MIRTDSYNRKIHHATFAGNDLFREAADGSKPLSVHALARSSTWTKVFDLNNEGLTEHNYQAYTYDFTVSTIPDLREYNADDYEIETVTFDGEVLARMICVADAFDAMNSNRVYRNKLTKEDIINEIEKNKGKQFDPKIADIFLRLIKDRNFDFEVIPNPGNGSTF